MQLNRDLRKLQLAGNDASHDYWYAPSSSPPLSPLLSQSNLISILYVCSFHFPFEQLLIFFAFIHFPLFLFFFLIFFFLFLSFSSTRHIERVWKLAREIARLENIRNTEVVELSALLHDIRDWKYSGRYILHNILYIFICCPSC